jgi:hypothetical protein
VNPEGVGFYISLLRFSDEKAALTSNELDNESIISPRLIA